MKFAYLRRFPPNCIECGNHVWRTELLSQWWIHTVKQVLYNIISSGFKRKIFRASGFKSCNTSFKLSTVILSLRRPCSENKTDSNFKDYNVLNDSCLAMDEGTTEGGSWRGGFQSHFPAHIFSKSHFSVLKNIYPIPILTLFSHSQCPNPSRNALNPIFPRQQNGNPSSHFTPLTEEIFRVLGKNPTHDLCNPAQMFWPLTYKNS